MIIVDLHNQRNQAGKMCQVAKCNITRHIMSDSIIHVVRFMFLFEISSLVTDCSQVLVFKGFSELANYCFMPSSQTLFWGSIAAVRYLQTMQAS